MNVNILKTILKDLIMSSTLNDTDYLLKNESIVKDLDLPEPIYHTEISSSEEMKLDGKFMLLEPLIINGGELVLKEGTELIVKENVGIRIINGGKLIVEGSKMNPVTIKSSGDKKFFNGIYIKGNNDNVGVLRHLNIINAKNEDNCSIVIEDVGKETILNNINITEILDFREEPSIIGICAINGNPKIQDCNFYNLLENIIVK